MNKNLLSQQQHLEEEFINLMKDKLAANVKAPDYVYHYTSIESFLKIIESNTLWFTHMSFQNDPLEVNFGIDVILHVLSKNENVLKTIIGIITKMHDRYKKSALNLTRDPLFMFSVSAARDDLPQWVQYGDNGNGVCIEFVGKYLFDNVAKIMGEQTRQVMYFPIQYYTNYFSPNARNLKAFEKDILSSCESMSNYIQENDIANDQNIQTSIYEMTRAIASFIKNEFFSKEEEWRLVITTAKIVTEPAKRVGNDFIMPEDDKNKIFVVPYNHSLKMYLRVPLDKAINPGSHPLMMGCIDDVILGPIHKDDDRISSGIEMAIWNSQKTQKNVSFSNGFLRGKQ
jgi:hypothetical protein